MPQPLEIGEVVIASSDDFPIFDSRCRGERQYLAAAPDMGIHRLPPTGRYETRRARPFRGSASLPVMGMFDVNAPVNVVVGFTTSDCLTGTCGRVTEENLATILATFGLAVKHLQ